MRVLLGTLLLCGLLAEPVAAQSWIGARLDGTENFTAPGDPPASRQYAGSGRIATDHHSAGPRHATGSAGHPPRPQSAAHHGSSANHRRRHDPWRDHRPGPPQDAGEHYDNQQDRNYARYQQSQRWLDYERESALARATDAQRQEIISDYDKRQQELERSYDYRNDAARDSYFSNANQQRQAERKENKPFNWNYNTQWFWAPHDTGPRWD